MILVDTTNCVATILASKCALLNLDKLYDTEPSMFHFEWVMSLHWENLRGWEVNSRAWTMAEAWAVLNTRTCCVNYVQLSITHSNNPLYCSRKKTNSILYLDHIQIRLILSKSIFEYEGQKNNPLITMFMSPFLVTQRK